MLLYRKILIFSLILGLFSACKKDNFIKDSSAKLEFSQDSVLFDTVFTMIGSATKQFKIYNPHNKTISISSIRLAKGVKSSFRLNVDGISGILMQDIEIPKKDSLYVFVEVTVDPTQKNNPIVIRDSIVFETNGNSQDVDLEAWGQDAYYHVPTVFPKNFPAYSVIKCNDTWVSDKPHVIYGYAIVDSGCTLAMQGGTRVYLHDGAGLMVYSDGTLKIQGTPGNTVNIQGDRLEKEYQDVPGQWERIWLSSGSKNNVIDWAVIKGGIVGIQADTLGASLNPTLTLSNSIILHSLQAGLWALGSYIKANNCVFANSERYAASLDIGGDYTFEHCTFANFWSGGNRQTPLLHLKNWYEDYAGNIQIRNLKNAYFGNCIVYGNQENEIHLDSTDQGGIFKFFFENTLLKIDPDINTNSGYHYKQIYKNEDPEFKDIRSYDFNLSPSSIARDKGNGVIGSKYPKDLNNLPRDIVSPDLGAYEHKP